MEFGSYVRELRKVKHYSLRQLAAAAEIDFTYLSKMETGRFPPPSEDVIVRLAVALDADKDELLALANKVDTELLDFIVNNPEAPKLLRQWKEKNIPEARKILKDEKKPDDSEAS